MGYQSVDLLYLGMIAATPLPPYYAVIFTSVRTTFEDGYDETAGRIAQLASEQPGYLGMDSARSAIGITVSYWQSLESILAWKQQAEHVAVQELGKKQWYAAYTVRVCLVERAYSFHEL